MRDSDRNVKHALLIDLDGVLYQAGVLIDGAIETLQWIREQQIPHLFVTNTTSRSRARLVDKFEALGFSAGVEEIMTPVVAAAQWLRDHRLKRAALFVPESTQQDFGDIEAVARDRGEAVEAVIVGDLGAAWTFDILNQAFRLLMQEPRPQLIALGMTRYWRTGNGLQLDVAPFVKALEHAASCEAVVVGKPAAAFFEASLAKLQCSAEHALMIGDDLIGDVGAAQPAKRDPGLLHATSFPSHLLAFV